MNVVHVQKVNGLAGSERHLLELLPRLGHRGIDVTMCVLTEPGSEEFAARLRHAGVAMVGLEAGHDLNLLLAPRIARVATAQGADLVHTHLVHADTYGQLGARLAGARGVRSVHGTVPELARQPYRSAGVLAGRLARRTIAISEHARRYAIESGLAPADRVRVVPYGVDTDAWDFDEGRRASVRASLGLGADELAIGVASRLVPHKGHDFLLDGFAVAHTEVPSIRLLVAGDGPMREQLEAAARSQGPAVTFLGYLEPDRLKEFMHGCDVIAFPSLPAFGEGFGLAALEASAAGRPVVATDVASLPEIVDNETTGLLVPPGDVHALAAALVRCARDPELRTRMGAAGRLRARERFSVDRMVDRTVAVYEEALR